MKATLHSSMTRHYSVRVGSDSCALRAYEIEPIADLFAADRDPAATSGTDEPHELLAACGGIDELVAETMISPPPVRRRRRTLASRAMLMGINAGE